MAVAPALRFITFFAIATALQIILSEKLKTDYLTRETLLPTIRNRETTPIMTVSKNQQHCLLSLSF